MSYITVVITAHNEAAAIRRTLLDLAAQTCAVDVVLIDDRSTDATRSEALAAGLDALTLLSSGADPEAALTPRQQALDKGFRAAMGTVILTLDADSRVAPDWAAALSAPIRSGRAGAVAGPVAFSGRGFIPRWQSCDAAHYLTVCRLLSALRLGGAGLFGNFAFRRELYGQVGGFAALGPTVTEDFAFSRVLGRQGTRLAYPGRKTLVTVRGLDRFGALVDRTLRVTSAPPTVLAAVLTIWPLTLLFAAVVALIWPGAAGILALRYGLGVALTAWAVRRNGRPRDAVAAPLYEPFVFVLAAAALVARLRGRRVNWGGRELG